MTAENNLESMRPMLTAKQKTEDRNVTCYDKTAVTRTRRLTDDKGASSSCCGVSLERGDVIRLVTKAGESNVNNGRAAGSGTFVGLFTFLVDAQWRWTGLVFFASFYLTWTIFAVLFWLICYFHGDFNQSSSLNVANDNTTQPTDVCIENIKDFTSIFLFSLEIQTTIGFGFSRVTENCAAAIVTLTVQAILGTIIEAFLVGVVFAKLVRTKQRAQAITFSETAVICMQDGILCFMFRLADRHTSRVIGARLRATFIRHTRTTKEGHTVTMEQHPLDLNPSGENSDLLLLWPTTIVHAITPDSPLYGITEEKLAREVFEIIVTLEGTTASTDMSTQAMTSFLPSEILWGYRFDEMIIAKDDKGRPTVEHGLLSNVYPVQVDNQTENAQYIQQC